MTRFHSLSCLSTLWNVWLTTKCPFSDENIFPEFLEEAKDRICGASQGGGITAGITEYESCIGSHIWRNLTSYVTSSPRSASVMRILEIFSQGPWSTRVTSGCSSSRSRVLSLKTQKEPNEHEEHAASPDCTAVKRGLTSRLVDHVQNKLLRFILHLQRGQLRLLQVWICPGRRHFFKSVYPKLVQQQVEDLSRGHRAVDTNVRDRAVRWSEHRRLGGKRKKRQHICSREDKKYWNAFILVVPGTLWMFWKGRSKEILPAGTC